MGRSRKKLPESVEDATENTRDIHEKDGDDTITDILEMFGSPGKGPSNIKVERKSPHQYRGYIATFCVDPSEEGILTFYDELREAAGGGVYRLQICGMHGHGGFGPTRVITLSGRPVQYDPDKKKRDDAARLGTANSFVVPVHPPQSQSSPPSDAMMGLLRELIERRENSGSLSREDLIEAFRGAMPAVAQAPAIRDTMSEMKGVFQTYREMREIFGGGDDHGPVRGDDGWLSAVKTLGPMVLGGLQALANRPPQTQYAPPGWQMQPPPGWQPGATPSPMGGPVPPAAHPPQASAQSPSSAVSAQQSASPTDDECDDECEDGEYIEGPLTPEEIEGHFSAATDEEKIKIIAKLLPHAGVPLSEGEIANFIRSQKSSSPTGTAHEATSNGVLSEH